MLSPAPPTVRTIIERKSARLMRVGAGICDSGATGERAYDQDAREFAILFRTEFGGVTSKSAIMR